MVEGLSDDEIARRWWRLFPQRGNEDSSPADPTDADLLAIHGDEKVLIERRMSLSSVSWFMRCTSEVIARMRPGPFDILHRRRADTEQPAVVADPVSTFTSRSRMRTADSESKEISW